jgi:hypothetical protein
MGVKIIAGIGALIFLYLVIANAADANNTLNGLGKVATGEIGALQGN